MAGAPEVVEDPRRRVTLLPCFDFTRSVGMSVVGMGEAEVVVSIGGGGSGLVGAGGMCVMDSEGTSCCGWTGTEGDGGGGTRQKT